MKFHFASFAGVILLMLEGMTISGCVSMMAPSSHMTDSMSYVRQHKGEGLRRSLLGSEAELMDNVVKSFELQKTYTTL